MLPETDARAADHPRPAQAAALTSVRERQIESAFRRALEAHKAGRIDDAERAYRSILALEERHAGAILFLGVVHYDRREFDEAIRLMSRAIELSPREPS